MKPIAQFAKELSTQCQQKECPDQCDSCGATKIDDLVRLIMGFKLEIDTSGEQEAMERVRTDLMTFITTSNNEFNELLRKKATVDAECEDTFEGECQCEEQKLEVLKDTK